MNRSASVSIRKGGPASNGNGSEVLPLPPTGVSSGEKLPVGTVMIRLQTGQGNVMAKPNNVDHSHIQQAAEKPDAHQGEGGAPASSTRRCYPELTSALDSAEPAQSQTRILAMALILNTRCRTLQTAHTVTEVSV
jgi:hypothetical protein